MGRCDRVKNGNPEEGLFTQLPLSSAPSSERRMLGASGCREGASHGRIS